MIAVLGWATTQSEASGSTVVKKATPTAQKQTRCSSARSGVAFYRQRYSQHRAVRGLETPYPAGRKPINCADAHYLAEMWSYRAQKARAVTTKWLEMHTLTDYPYCSEGCRAWHKATDEVQRAFPGSKGWMMSCSATEGGWGRWVVHGGGSYYPGAEYDKGGAQVGGNLQFTYGTFAYMYNAGVKDLVRRAYRLPSHLRGGASVTAWRSALGQAIAGGAAYTLGLRGSHWAGSGC